MKMAEMLLAINELRKKDKYICQSCLINYINTAYTPRWNVSLTTVRRRIKYLQSSNIGTWDKSHVCSICGKRKSNVVSLYPNITYYIDSYLEQAKNYDGMNIIEGIDLIGQPSLLSYYFRFTYKMASQDIDYISTSRKVADELGMNYNIMLINLNRLEKMFLFVKKITDDSRYKKYIGSEATLKYVEYIKKNLTKE